MSPKKVHWRGKKENKNKNERMKALGMSSIHKGIYDPLRTKEIARKGNDKKVGCQDQNWGWKANQILIWLSYVKCNYFENPHNSNIFKGHIKIC